MPSDTSSAVSFFARVVLALRILFDRELAGRVAALTRHTPTPLPPHEEERRLPASTPPVVAAKVVSTAPLASPPTDGALALLSLLQREGRLVDFLQQDVAAFPDSEIGAAARVVHEGCRKALHAHAELERVRTEPEGSTITLAVGYDGSTVKLVGDVRGEPPYRGVLRHSGWRARSIRLPDSVAGHDPSILAQAEVEL